MEPDDPFGWIMEACQMSSSEEFCICNCSYFGQSDSDDSGLDSAFRNPPDIPVASDGIIMVSPLKSPEDELSSDQYAVTEDPEIFHTPPESRSISTSFDNCNDDRIIGNGIDRDRETVPIDADNADSGRAVDLGRDTDLGFSEVEVDLTQRIEASSNQDDSFRRESEEIRVPKREFSPTGKLPTESASKRLKSFRSPSVHLGTPKERNSEKLLKSLKNVSPSAGATLELELENQQSHEYNFEVSEGNGRKRRLDFPTEAIDSESEERSRESENNTEELLESLKNASPSPEATPELELENQQNHAYNFEAGEGSDRKRRLNFSTEAIDSESEERNMESEDNNGEDSSNREKNLEVLTKDMECDTEEINIESETDDGELNSGRNKNIVRGIDQVTYTGENGSNSRAMEEKTERKRALPSWSNWRVEDDESADEEREVNEMDSWANARMGADEKADKEQDGNERETVHSRMDSDGLSENFEEVTILDVLMELEKDCEEDRSLECLSLLEVAEKKWGTFSSTSDRSQEGHKVT